MLQNIMRRNSKKQNGGVHQTLKSISLKEIESMQVLDSEDHFRFLKSKRGIFVVFNGRLNQTYYSCSKVTAERFFNNLINK